MQYVRSKLFDVVLVLWTLLMSSAIPVLMICGKPRAGIRRVAQIWLRGIELAIWYIIGLQYIERGRENIPDGPCLIVANHQSPWETIILALKFPNAAFVVKAELGRIPAVGWGIKNYPMILIDRASGAKAARQLVFQSKAAVLDGQSILIFPEGTRKSTADRVVFKRGVEFLYSELGLPVLPIAVNSGAFWGPDRSFKNRGVITVSYLPVIQPGLSRADFYDKAQTILQSEKEKLIAELDIAPGV